MSEREAGAEFQRLGKRHLGRHAFEDRMPDSIYCQLAEEDVSNSVAGVVPNLAFLLEREKGSGVAVAYLCTEHAVQVHKLASEGAHFCGYRNIQMLLLAVASGRSSGRQKTSANLPFTTKPTILQLQNLIEEAWDAGVNPHGRILTGGIKDTRKHIGPSEAEALLLFLSIPCTGTAFHSPSAWKELLDHVEAYFTRSTSAQESSHPIVHRTNRPPIFLQRPAHSLTVIGIERLRNGHRRLLVFDPAWRPPTVMQLPLASKERSGWKDKWYLMQYRKTERSLKRFRDFEILTIDG